MRIADLCKDDVAEPIARTLLIQFDFLPRSAASARVKPATAALVVSYCKLLARSS